MDKLKRAKTMRICLYTETALPKIGGHEMAVDALARQYQNLGHEVTVLAPQPKKLVTRDSDLPYSVVRHPRFYSSRWFVSFYCRYLLGLYRRWPFDVLHCHGIYPPGWLASQLRDRIPVPLVITSHGGDVYEKNVRLAKALVKQRLTETLASADLLVSISSFTRQGFERLCPKARRIVDIPNGADLDLFDGPAARPAGLDPAIQPEQYAVFLGRLKSRKGVDLLLSALAQIPPRGGVEQVIVGDGEERPRLEALAKQLGLEERVRGQAGRRRESLFVAKSPVCRRPVPFVGGAAAGRSGALRRRTAGDRHECPRPGRPDRAGTHGTGGLRGIQGRNGGGAGPTFPRSR